MLQSDRSCLRRDPLVFESLKYRIDQAITTFELMQSPQEILVDAYSRFDASRIAISFSGAEDVVLIDMASRIRGSNIQVFTLDTGRLHAETYRFIEDVRIHYQIVMEVLSPESHDVEQLVREKGLFSFYTDGHTQCCGVRKISSLQRKIPTLDAWITGQRRDQGATRIVVPTEQTDNAFSTSNHHIAKFNPLAHWTSNDVWDYIKAKNVPYNPLHDQGYVSIGCEPCTRPVKAGGLARSGRWWWENEEDKECGLHAENLTPQVIRLPT